MRLFPCLLLPAALSAHAMPPAEEARVRELIARIEQAQGAVFIRNGTEYGAANAAEFLRRKCGKELGKLASAREFVTSCAGVSSTSGKPYLIRLKDAAPRPSAQVLGEWLDGIERDSK
jgi:hypothetical protein